MVENDNVDVAVRQPSEASLSRRHVIDLIAAAAKNALDEPSQSGVVIDIESLDDAVGHYRAAIDWIIRFPEPASPRRTTPAA
jgi:hypothetical protein